MSAEREIPAEDSIKVVCRFRPLNDSEEKAGSKFVVKFPNNVEENCISIAVSIGIGLICGMSCHKPELNLSSESITSSVCVMH